MKTKNQKGITLIALIITIIVMLILVGVTVNIALDGGLFKATQGVAKNTQQAVEDETNLSSGKIQGATLEEYVNSFGSGGWTYNHATQTVTKDGTVLKIGDYVDYTTPTYIDYTEYNLGDGTSWKYGEGRNYGNGNQADPEGWRILGVDDNGQLLLVSETVINQSAAYATRIAGNATSTTDGKDIDYSKAVETLNKICEPFADGTIAINGRSLNVSDINKLTGYDPTKTGLTGDKGIFDAGQMREYNNNVTVAKSNTGYTLTGANGATATATSFKNLKSTTDLTGSTNVTTNYYSYYLESLTSTRPDTYDTSTLLYDLIYGPTYHTDQYHYWLADTYSEVKTSARWGMRCVSMDSNNKADGTRIMGSYVWDSSSGLRLDDEGKAPGAFVRAVITLAGDTYLVAGEGTKESPRKFSNNNKVEELDLTGSTVKYNAGGVTSWSKLSTDDANNTVSVWAKIKAPNLSGFTSEEQLQNYLDSRFINPLYAEQVVSVSLTSVYDICGSIPMEFDEWSSAYSTINRNGLWRNLL